METKVCSKCKQTKNISCFYTKGKEKRTTSWCKECISAGKKKRYAENPEPARAQMRKYHHRVKNVRRVVWRWQKMKYRHGIGEKEYNELLVRQRGYCAICGIHQTILGKPLGVDHDHKTGKIRGLLCDKCNFAIGYLQDDTRNVLAALKYLEQT